MYLVPEQVAEYFESGVYVNVIKREKGAVLLRDKPELIADRTKPDLVPIRSEG